MVLRCLSTLLLALVFCACANGSTQLAVTTIPRLSLPAPSVLLKQIPRKIKSTDAQVARNGAQYEAALLNQHVAVQGTSAQFTPQWQPPFSTGFDGLACALYQFDLLSYDRDDTLRLTWGTAGAQSQAWIGLSDTANDRWEWHAAPANDTLALSDATTYAAADGTALVAIVLTGTGTQELDEVRFGAGTATGPHELWFYLQTNLQVQANVDSAIALVNRAAAAGYTTCVLADSKLDRIVDPNLAGIYWPKLQAFDTACKAAGVRLVPSMCGIGWSDALLFQGPDLIEGQEARDAEFLVSGNTADVVQDASVTNGGFENHAGDAFNGWNQMDGAGQSTFADSGTVHGGSTSIRYENFPSGNPTGNDRISQAITVKPWQHYVLSFWLKTDSVSPGGSLWCRVFDPTINSLTLNEPYIPTTQDWTQYHISFDSQDQTQVLVYLGIWGGVSGRFWVDDLTIENAGLMNLIRRDGAPFEVRSEDGSTIFVEGSDYDYAVDPLMGMAAGYPGTYDTWHTRPVLTIPGGSPIQDGDILKVRSYHAIQTDDGKVCCCLTEDGVYDIIQANLEKLQELIQPQGLLIAVDELRIANWCDKCVSTGKTPGELLADCTARIDSIAKTAVPAAQLIVWSDMYDPDHNAVSSYYQCNGSMVNSFANNPPADWDIANWRFFDNGPNGPETTLSFFSGRGNRQILSGYYDRGDSSDIGPWLDKTTGLPGVYACMYTTWSNDYDELENWAQAVRDWEAANP